MKRNKIIKILDDYVHIRVAERIADQILSLEPSDTAVMSDDEIDKLAKEAVPEDLYTDHGGFPTIEDSNMPKRITWIRGFRKALSLTSTNEPMQEEHCGNCYYHKILECDISDSGDGDCMNCESDMYGEFRASHDKACKYYANHHNPQPQKADSSNRACPCNYGKPCKENCTCVNEFSSAGCDCCCTYGSIEQREAMAKHLKPQKADSNGAEEFNVIIEKYNYDIFQADGDNLLIEQAEQSCLYRFKEYFANSDKGRWKEKMIEFLQSLMNIRDILEYPEDTKEEHKSEAIAVYSMLDNADDLLEELIHLK